MARGILGDMNTPFTLDLLDGMRTTSTNPQNIDFVVVHGSTDAPTVDVIARNTAKLAEDISYGERTDYIEVPASNYIVDVVDPVNNDLIVASYNAQFIGAPSFSAVVFASGFLNPQNPDDPAFGLFAALSNGDIVELPAVENKAFLQVIHNSPTPTVDIWIDGQKAIDSFSFRTATPFIELPAGVNLVVGIAPYPSDDAGDIIATFGFVLTPQQNFIAMASGILGDMNNPFLLLGYTPAQRNGRNANNVDFTVYHGSTDAPAVNVTARGVGTIADTLEYGEFTPYLSVPAADYTLDVRPTSSPDLIAASFTAPLSGLAGGAAVVFASGFLTPNNMDDPAFGLFAALPDGTVLELPEAQRNARSIDRRRKTVP